jgi:hypothetical protein
MKKSEQINSAFSITTLLTDQTLSEYLRSRGIRMSVATIKKKHADIESCPPSAKVGVKRYYKMDQVNSWIDGKFSAIEGTVNGK